MFKITSKMTKEEISSIKDAAYKILKEKYPRKEGEENFVYFLRLMSHESEIIKKI